MPKGARLLRAWGSRRGQAHRDGEVQDACRLKASRLEDDTNRQAGSARASAGAARFRSVPHNVLISNVKRSSDGVSRSGGDLSVRCRGHRQDGTDLPRTVTLVEAEAGPARRNWPRKTVPNRSQLTAPWCYAIERHMEPAVGRAPQAPSPAASRGDGLSWPEVGSSPGPHVSGGRKLLARESWAPPRTTRALSTERLCGPHSIPVFGTELHSGEL